MPSMLINGSCVMLFAFRFWSKLERFPSMPLPRDLRSQCPNSQYRPYGTFSSHFGLPALPCRAFTYRRCAAGRLPVSAVLSDTSCDTVSTAPKLSHALRHSRLRSRRPIDAVPIVFSPPNFRTGRGTLRLRSAEAFVESHPSAESALECGTHR